MKLSRPGRRAVLPLVAAGLAAPFLMASRGVVAAQDPRDAVVEMVETGCRALERYGFPRGVGRAAPDTWSRLGSGLYVFLLNPRGRLLLHPDSQMDGADVSGARDLAGKLFIREILAAAAAHPEGVWTDYLWPDGSTGEPGTKHTYSKAAQTPDAGRLIASAGYIATEI